MTTEESAKLVSEWCSFSTCTHFRPFGDLGRAQNTLEHLKEGETNDMESLAEPLFRSKVAFIAHTTNNLILERQAGVHPDGNYLAAIDLSIVRASQSVIEREKTWLECSLRQIQFS